MACCSMQEEGDDDDDEEGGAAKKKMIMVRCPEKPASSCASFPFLSDRDRDHTL